MAACQLPAKKQIPPLRGRNDKTSSYSDVCEE